MFLNKGRRIAESGVMLALTVIIFLIIFYVPLIGTIFTFLLPVPFALLAIKYGAKWSSLCLFASLLLSVILGVFLVVLPLALIFGLIGIIMGHYLHNHKSKLEMFILSVLVTIFGLVASFAALSLLMDIDFIGEIESGVHLYAKQINNIMESNGQGEQLEAFNEELQLFLDTARLIMPAILVLSSIFMTAISFLLSKPFINRFSDHPLHIAPLREMKLPKSLLWYYLIIMIVSLFINVESGNFMYQAIVNIMVCLQFLMYLQGISFLFFFSHFKGWNKTIPVVITTLSLILPIASLIRILGIIDLGFDLRKVLEQTKS